MNKFSKFLFLGALSFGLWSCSADEPGNSSGDQGTISDGQANYMSVSLISTDGSTRATADGYEDGSSAENKIENVRFYFFDANGAAAPVKIVNNQRVNYYDWKPGTLDPDGQKPDQVEDDDTSNDVAYKLSTATIIINTQKGDHLPSQVVAVINPVETAQTRSLSDLTNIAKNYAESGYTTAGNFVMFNSVYADLDEDGNNEVVNTVKIKPDNLQKTIAAARENAVKIYVERSVAKVSVSIDKDFSSDNGVTKIKLKDKDDNDLKINNQDGTQEQVYLQLEGWRLTADSDKGRLVKSIDASWYGHAWKNGTHRSCWAFNASGTNSNYYKYDQIPSSATSPLGSALYTNENAENRTLLEGQKINKTKVILRGKLCKEDGTALTLYRHMGAHFADVSDNDESKNLLKLKESILEQFSANGCHYYYQDGDTRKQIGVGDLKIVIAPQQSSENSSNNCYVYAQLTDAAKGKVWYNSLDADASVLTDLEETVNKDLKDKEYVDWALVWKNGMTYYYYEIVHNGTGQNATKGVVRNHVYKTTITKIAGLGTPVYDPTQVIYPEKPDPNENYIAAQINVLAWHIISGKYELEW